jgi:hypothetical protein
MMVIVAMVVQVSDTQVRMSVAVVVLYKTHIAQVPSKGNVMADA